MPTIMVPEQAGENEKIFGKHILFMQRCKFTPYLDRTIIQYII
jgi:hypothetical protein